MRAVLQRRTDLGFVYILLLDCTLHCQYTVHCYVQLFLLLFEEVRGSKGKCRVPYTFVHKGVPARKGTYPA